MTQKSVVILIDDFSDRVLDYDNTYLYDFFYTETLYVEDRAYDQYGNYDYNWGTSTGIWDYTEYADNNYDYFGEVIESDISWRYANNTDRDNGVEPLLDLVDYRPSTLISSGAINTYIEGYDYYGYPIYNQGTYYYYNIPHREMDAYNHPSLYNGLYYSTEAAHGDWVLEAFHQTLDDPSRTAIICIDIDFDYDGAINWLNYSELGSPSLDGLHNTWLEWIYDDWSNKYQGNDSYELIGASMSIAGGEVVDFERAFVNAVISNGVFFTQSTPNVGGGMSDFASSGLTEVISVGAWNVASNGEALNGDIYTIESGNIDIYGNGYVSKSGTGWGETFGTSFATPKVAADLTNFYNNMYLASESGDTQTFIQHLMFWSDLYDSIQTNSTTDLWGISNGISFDYVNYANGIYLPDVVSVRASDLNDFGINPSIVYSQPSGLNYDDDYNSFGYIEGSLGLKIANIYENNQGTATTPNTISTNQPFTITVTDDDGFSSFNSTEWYWLDLNTAEFGTISTNSNESSYTPTTEDLGNQLYFEENIKTTADLERQLL